VHTRNHDPQCVLVPDQDDTARYQQYRTTGWGCQYIPNSPWWNPILPVVQPINKIHPKYRQCPPFSFPNLDVNYLSVCHMDYLVYMIIISSHEYKITMLLNNSDNMNDFQYNKICPSNPSNINLINITLYSCITNPL